MNIREYFRRIMVLFLLFILIGGLFFPILGYTVVFMMLFLLTLSYFKGRYWCSHICPRGSFFDLVLTRFSFHNKIPKLFLNQKFKWVVFYFFVTFFVIQIIVTEKTLLKIGFIFVRMCIITTIFSIVLGIPFKPRTWCTFCPMGLLQNKIHAFKK